MNEKEKRQLEEAQKVQDALLNDPEIQRVQEAILNDPEIQKVQEALTLGDIDNAAKAAAISEEDIKRLQEAAANIIKAASDAIQAGIQATTKEAPNLAETIKQLKKTADALQAFLQSETYKSIKAQFNALKKYLADKGPGLFTVADALNDFSDFEPFLELAIKEAGPDFPADAYTTEELLREGLDEDGNPTDTPAGKIIQKARQHKAAYEETGSFIETIEELPRIIAIPVEKLEYPLDKLDNVIWDLLASGDQGGQLQLSGGETVRMDTMLNIGTSKQGSKQDAVIYYGINFDELENVRITKQLTPYDKRCYIAAAALYNAGNQTVTATQIYKAMGNSGRPKAEDLQKINDSITKMGAARVYIDNTEEVKATKGGYRGFKYDAALLPFERISAYINGTLTDSAIKLFREPPLITFAKQRNQITTITRQVLESPINKTDANLRIDDYLLERIGHMKSKRNNTSKKILFSTLFRECGITTAKQKQRAPEKIKRYLDHYEKCGWIKGYQEKEDGITILM